MNRSAAGEDVEPELKWRRLDRYVAFRKKAKHRAQHCRPDRWR